MNINDSRVLPKSKNKSTRKRIRLRVAGFIEIRHSLRDIIDTLEKSHETHRANWMERIKHDASPGSSISRDSLCIRVVGADDVPTRMLEGAEGCFLRQAFNNLVRAKATYSQKKYNESLSLCFDVQESLGIAVGLFKSRCLSNEVAKSNARASHRPKIAMRTEVIDRWRKDVDSTLSAQKAADELLGIFTWPNGKDVSHRTLAEWISKEKKKKSNHP